MRLRRLCSIKKGEKCLVDQTTREDYLAGGERREWLELALLDSIKTHGTDRSKYKAVKAGCVLFFAVSTCQGEFLTRVVTVRKRMMEKSKEIHGKWMTEERLNADYSKRLGCSKPRAHHALKEKLQVFSKVDHGVLQEVPTGIDEAGVWCPEFRFPFELHLRGTLLHGLMREALEIQSISSGVLCGGRDADFNPHCRAGEHRGKSCSGRPCKPPDMHVNSLLRRLIGALWIRQRHLRALTSPACPPKRQQPRQSRASRWEPQKHKFLPR